jgi:hypothetical protein
MEVKGGQQPAGQIKILAVSLFLQATRGTNTFFRACATAHFLGCKLQQAYHYTLLKPNMNVTV